MLKFKTIFTASNEKKLSDVERIRIYRQNQTEEVQEIYCVVVHYKKNK